MTTRPVDPKSTTGGGFAWRERLFTTLQRRGAIAVLILVVAIAALTLFGGVVGVRTHRRRSSG